MGKQLFLVLIISISFSANSLAAIDSVAFYTDLDLALEVAKQKNKSVFAVVEYGKRVLKELVIPIINSGEVDELADQFVFVDLDNDPRIKYIKSTTSRTYPIIIIFDQNGEELYRQQNCCDWSTKNGFEQMTKFALSKPLPRRKYFESHYSENKNDADFLEKYAGLADTLMDYKLVDKISTDYYDLIDETPRERWMDFVMINVTRENSKNFKYLVKHKSDFDKKFTEEIVNRIVLKILIADQLSHNKKIKTDKFVKNLLDKLEDYDMFMVDKFFMPFIASVYNERRQMFQDDDGQFAIRILNSYANSLDKAALDNILWDYAYFVDNRIQLERALTHLEDTQEVSENFWDLECKSILLFKLGEFSESNRLVKINEGFSNQLNIEYKSYRDKLIEDGFIGKL